MYAALFILLLLALVGMIFCHFRRKKIICRIQGMDRCEKCALVEELAKPFGYAYHCRCGYFSSTQDAWQKTAGYTRLYDYLAPRFGMVFDALPVYFDYRGKTWLIQFWKGQYGINTGGEIGIYHADRVLSESEYPVTLFQAAEDTEMLPCSLELYRENGDFVRLSERHWWLTAFLPGVFSRPSDLCLRASICFPDGEMLEAFRRGLCRAGYPGELITVQNLSLSFAFHRPLPEHYGLLTRFWRGLSQCVNRISCRLFVRVTRPFVCTEDRILFLYYYIPVCFRKLMRLRRYDRRCHRRNGCQCPKGCCGKKHGRQAGSCGEGKDGCQSVGCRGGGCRRGKSCRRPDSGAGCRPREREDS